MNEELRNKISRIKLIGTDFDGVCTDGKVTTDQNGNESVTCSRKETLRIKDVKAAGIEVFVISKEQNAVVARRCEKMKVEFKQGIDGKLAVFKALLADRGLTPDEAIFIGDDTNDLDCLKHAGLAMTVADGDPLCKAEADYITTRNGGDHAMREIFDLVLSVRAPQ